MRKPTGSSGIDDMTAKCQSLQRCLYQIDGEDTFGDEMDQDEVSEVGPKSSVSDDDILDEDEQYDNINTQTEVVEKAKNLIVPNTQESSVTKVTMPTSNTK